MDSEKTWKVVSRHCSGVSWDNRKGHTYGLHLGLLSNLLESDSPDREQVCCHDWPLGLWILPSHSGSSESYPGFPCPSLELEV